MSGYSHILFDHDGVLVNTEPLYYKATRQILAEMGVELSLNDYLCAQAAGNAAWFAARDKGYGEVEIAAGRDQRNVLYQTYLQEEDISIAGVNEALGRLGKQCRMAIVTTAKPADFALIHYGLKGQITSQDQRGIVSHMDFVLANGDYERSKPHPDPYLAGLDRFGIEPSQALVVEDSERGLRAAVAAGVDCAVVHHEFTASQDFSAATYRIKTLAELMNIVG